MRKNDLVCFAHLRWGFTFQRPNHLMARFARERRVFYVEEPVRTEGAARIAVEQPIAADLWVCTPHVPEAYSDAEVAALITDFLTAREVNRPVVWMYSPMMLPLAAGVEHVLFIYDCMDELSLFLNAPKELHDNELRVLSQAQLVFTGGQSLYEAKRKKHPRVFAFPSSVDAEHFRPHASLVAPEDQADLPQPRVGFFGVIDERMDLELVRHLAQERPHVSFVFVGPVVKISPSDLPVAPNLHYLGPKLYADLPSYVAGWDVAIMPFALNHSTRFISPTKTLEYLAARKPIVSTAIADVVRPYGEQGIVQIAAQEEFCAALDRAIAGQTKEERQRADEVLAATSWDATWLAMSQLVTEAEFDGFGKKRRPNV